MSNEKILPAQSQSPTSKNVEKVKDNGLFDFPTAIKKITDGYKISKKEWDDENYYGVLVDEKVMLHKPDGTNYCWIIKAGDLTGVDWFIINK